MIKKPNILFILTDQQRKDTLGAYDETMPCFTPNLDALAKESTVFENAYTTCPICTPARSSLQTGLYPMHNGMINNSYNQGAMINELPDTPELLSRQLEKNHYQAGYTGKWHLGSGVKNIKEDAYIQKFLGDVDFGELRLHYSCVPTGIGYLGDDFPGHGFGGLHYPQFLQWLKDNGKESKIEHIKDHFYQNHRAGVVTSGVKSSVEEFLIERTKHLIDTFKDKKEPWYLQLNFWGPHEPYFVPEEFLKMYEDVIIPPWKNFSQEQTKKPAIHDVKRGNVSSWEELEPIVKHYFACITHIDYQIGRILAYLKENNLYDDTIIIFSADHGESLGIHNGLFDKAIFMYEETCHIPLFVKGTKDMDTPQKIQQFVNSTDIYSTILDYAGTPLTKAQRDGLSFKPLLEKKEVPHWPKDVVTECSGIGALLFSQRMYRKGDFKYVFNCGDIDELYDLKKDPYEITNLIDHNDYKEILIELKKGLYQWMEKHCDNLIFEYEALRLKNIKK